MYSCFLKPLINGQDIICFKQANYLVTYFLKEKQFRMKKLNDNIILDGQGSCRANEIAVITSGGVKGNGNGPNYKILSANMYYIEAEGVKEILPRMPLARYDHGTSYSDKTLIVIGGYNIEGRLLKSCYKFDLILEIGP